MLDRVDALNQLGIADYSYQGQVADAGAYAYLPAPAPLNQWVQGFWQLSIPSGSYEYKSVPDNHVDCIVPLGQPEQAFAVAPFGTPTHFAMTGPASYFGVRFRVLAHHGLTALPVGEWHNASLVDVFGEALVHSLLEASAGQSDFASRCKQAGKVLLATLGYRAIDKRLLGFVRHSYQSAASHCDLSDQQCARFGLSARHLRRLTQLYLGLSPRSFSRVARFQKALHVMAQCSQPQNWANHYYDQPHFIREFKAMAGVTPAKFRDMSVLYNT